MDFKSDQKPYGLMHALPVLLLMVLCVFFIVVLPFWLIAGDGVSFFTFIFEFIVGLVS